MMRIDQYIWTFENWTSGHMRVTEDCYQDLPISALQNRDSTFQQLTH